MADLTQNEKAYMKQGGLNAYNKYFLYGIEQPRRKITVKTDGQTSIRRPRKMHAVRRFKNVGLGIPTPADAIQGNYVDKKCPFTGNVGVSGRMLRGMVVSTKMQRSVVIRRDYLHYIRKYNRYEKRHTNITAHCSPAFKRIKDGDIATIGQCRPITKTIRFMVLKVKPNTIFGSVKKQFTLF